MPPKDFSLDGAAGAGASPTPEPGFGTSDSGVGIGTSTLAPNDSASPAIAYGGFGASPGFDSGNNYAEGGLVTDDDSDVPGGGGDDQSSTGQNDQTNQIHGRINDALTTVNDALSYGYKLHGLSDGEQQGAYDGADNSPQPGAPAAAKSPQSGSGGDAMPGSWNGPGHDYSDFRQSDNIEDRRTNDPTANAQPLGMVDQLTKNVNTNVGHLADQYRGAVSGYTNPLSKALGINDVGKPGGVQPQQFDDEETQ